MSGRPILRVRPAPRSWSEEPRVVGPCFERLQPADRAEARQSRPLLLSFDRVEFLDDLLSGLRALGPSRARPAAWPRLRALRDYAEPPRAALDARGQARYPASVARAPAPPAAVEPEPGLGSGLDELLLRDEGGGPAWLRKLYHPLHLRFSVLIDEVCCDARGMPPLARRRVVERGLVLRRLVLDPARERWQDWVIGPDPSRGVWTEIADEALQLQDGTPLDPAAPQLSASAAARARDRLGLGSQDALRLAVVRMAPVPPDAGPPGQRAAAFGVIPTFSADQEAPPLAETSVRRQLPALREELEAALGLCPEAPADALLWPELAGLAPGALAQELREARIGILARLGGAPAGLVTLAELGADVDARLAAEAARADGAEPSWPAPVADPTWGGWVKTHTWGRQVEHRVDAVERALSAAGDAAWPAAQRGDWRPGLPILKGVVDPLLDRLTRLPGPTAGEIRAFVESVLHRASQAAPADPGPPRPRLDGEHVYAAWSFARVRPCEPCCEPPRIVWSRRSEPFTLAEPLDPLGLRPARIHMPDLGRLARDLARIPRAGAQPMAMITTPADSGVSTGEEAADTARAWGVAWICSIGIPVLSFCAWVLFSFIFKILIALPGFSWMLLLKLCVPVPYPKKEQA